LSVAGEGADEFSSFGFVNGNAVFVAAGDEPFPIWREGDGAEDSWAEFPAAEPAGVDGSDLNVAGPAVDGYVVSGMGENEFGGLASDCGEEAEGGEGVEIKEFYSGVKAGDGETIALQVGRDLEGWGDLDRDVVGGEFCPVGGGEPIEDEFSALFSPGGDALIVF